MCGSNARVPRQSYLGAEICLTLISGSASLPVLDLTRCSHASIGRQVDNNLVIYDATCSRRHCVLKRVHRVWYVQDLSSRNGTFVNDLRICSECPLSNGDTIQIGGTHFQYVEIPPTDA